MKVKKDNVIKDVAENIVADYITAGWKKYEEPKVEEKPKKIEEKKEEKIKE